MNWPAIYSALMQAAALSGVSADSMSWNDQPSSPVWSSGATIGAQVSSARAYSWDEEVRTDPPSPNPDNLPQSVAMEGQRQFTWQVRVEVQDTAAERFALGYLDRLRARLQRSSTEVSILLPAGLAVIEIMPAVKVRNIKDTRSISTYVMEVVMAGVESDVDDTYGAGDYIGTVNLSSNTLKSTDGTDAPQQIVLTVVGT